MLRVAVLDPGRGALGAEAQRAKELGARSGNFIGVGDEVGHPPNASERRAIHPR